MELIGIFVASVGSFILGTLFNRGITVNINKNEPVREVQYNESMVDELDPSVRKYYDDNNGLNKY